MYSIDWVTKSTRDRNRFSILRRIIDSTYTFWNTQKLMNEYKSFYILSSLTNLSLNFMFAKDCSPNCKASITCKEYFHRCFFADASSLFDSVSVSLTNSPYSTVPLHNCKFLTFIHLFFWNRYTLDPLVPKNANLSQKIYF